MSSKYKIWLNDRINEIENSKLYNEKEKRIVIKELKNYPS